MRTSSVDKLARFIKYFFHINFLEHSDNGLCPCRSVANVAVSRNTNTYSAQPQHKLGVALPRATRNGTQIVYGPDGTPFSVLIFAPNQYYNLRRPASSEPLSTSTTPTTILCRPPSSVLPSYTSTSRPDASHSTTFIAFCPHTISPSFELYGWLTVGLRSYRQSGPFHVDSEAFHIATEKDEVARCCIQTTLLPRGTVF